MSAQDHSRPRALRRAFALIYLRLHRRKLRAEWIKLSSRSGAWPQFASTGFGIRQHRAVFLEGVTLCGRRVSETSTGEIRTLLGVDCRSCTKTGWLMKQAVREYEQASLTVTTSQT